MIAKKSFPLLPDSISASAASNLSVRIVEILGDRFIVPPLPWANIEYARTASNLQLILLILLKIRIFILGKQKIRVKNG